jgi:ribose transport system ATP-binding protein
MTLLEARSVSKSYPGVQALAGVDLSVDAGEVHALLGQNGAGKSTLMKIVAGSVTPDGGELALDGASIPLGSPDHAREHGIGIVYQELSLVPQLSIGENVLLGRWKPSRFGRLIGWKETFAEARKHLDRVGFDGDPSRPVSEFGMAERQLVELAKALSTDVRVLLLDEPTSALSDREARRLFTIIHELTLHDVAVIYVSHRLQELVEISDRVTVLRDGKVVENVRTRDVDEAQLARMMVGRATTLMRPPATEERRSTATGAVALRATGIARRPRLKEIDLELMEGEIVTVFGLMGAGRSRLAKTLFGLEPATAGRLEVLGRERRISSPVDAIDAGMGYVGEDRQGGLVPKMSVAANITLASLDSVFKGPLMNFDSERAEARRQVDDLAIRVQSVDAPVATLSGGNQQKVVLARWSCSGARVLLLDDPTRGIDVGAKEEVFRLVRRRAAEGSAILYLTSEVREARALGDRLLVMAGGAIVAAVDPATPEEEIIAAAGGVHA